MEKYKKYEFCKAVKCKCFIPMSVEHKINDFCMFSHNKDCTHTAKEFHHWLKSNGFEIVKKGQ